MNNNPAQALLVIVTTECQDISRSRDSDELVQYCWCQWGRVQNDEDCRKIFASKIVNVALFARFDWKVD